MCDHLEFRSEVKVTRLTDEGGNVTSYRADIEITCNDCHQPFRAIGVVMGWLDNQPSISPGGIELRVPITPIL